MGKYDGVMKNLKKVDKPRNERHDEIRASLTSTKPADLAFQWAEARREKKEQEKVLKGIDDRLYVLAGLLENSYEDEGISSLKVLETGESVSVGFEPYAQVEDRELFREWCIEVGMEQEMMLPWQTTNTILKEHLLAGKPEPPGLKAWIRTKLTLRKK